MGMGGPERGASSHQGPRAVYGARDLLSVTMVVVFPRLLGLLFHELPEEMLRSSCLRVFIYALLFWFLQMVHYRRDKNTLFSSKANI